MTPWEQVTNVLEDLETCALHVLRNPKNEPAKEDLRRACKRAAAFRAQEAAARAIEDARPGTPPPMLDVEELPAAQPEFRLPYRDD